MNAATDSTPGVNFRQFIYRLRLVPRLQVEAADEGVASPLNQRSESCGGEARGAGCDVAQATPRDQLIEMAWQRSGSAA